MESLCSLHCVVVLSHLFKMIENKKVQPNKRISWIIFYYYFGLSSEASKWVSFCFMFKLIVWSVRDWVFSPPPFLLCLFNLYLLTKVERAGRSAQSLAWGL